MSGQEKIMYAHELRANQPYVHGGQTYRAVGVGGRPSVNVATGLGFQPGPMVEVEPFTGTVPERVEQCCRCGEDVPVSGLVRSVERYYDWDNPDEDAQGSVLLERVVWTCSDEAECRRVRRGMARSAQMVADSEDAAARESGWGAIGGGR